MNVNHLDGVTFVRYFVLGIKGLVMSISQLIPGVSGSTIAIILGVYDRLIHAINNLTKNVREHAKLLGAVCIGAVIGIVLFAQAIGWMIDRYPVLLGLLFIGVILGGAPLMYKKAGERPIRPVHWLYFVVGVALVILMSLEVKSDSPAITELTLVNAVLLFLAGIIFAVALILPGISGSFMLLVLGLYNTLIEAASDMNLMILAPIGLGAVVGTFLTARVIEWMLTRFPQATYLLIFGFVLGSIFGIFPGWPNSWSEWLIGVMLFVAGFVFVYKTSMAESVQGSAAEEHAPVQEQETTNEKQRMKTGHD